MKTWVPSFYEWINEASGNTEFDGDPDDIRDIVETVNETANENCEGEAVTVKSPKTGKETRVSPCMLSSLIKKGWTQTDEE